MSWSESESLARGKRETSTSCGRGGEKKKKKDENIRVEVEWRRRRGSEFTGISPGFPSAVFSCSPRRLRGQTSSSDHHLHLDTQEQHTHTPLSMKYMCYDLWIQITLCMVIP